MLMLSMLGKIFSRQHLEILFFFFPPENRLRDFISRKLSPKDIPSVCHLLNLPKEWYRLKTFISDKDEIGTFEYLWVMF